MSSTSPQQLWIVNCNYEFFDYHLNCFPVSWTFLGRTYHVPSTFLGLTCDVPWMFLESIFCLATIFLPSCYLLPTHYFVFTKRIFHIIIVLWKNSAFINSELPINWIDLIFQFSIFNFQLSTFNSSLWIVNCELWIIILCVNTDFWKIFKNY